SAVCTEKFGHAATGAYRSLGPTVASPRRKDGPAAPAKIARAAISRPPNCTIRYLISSPTLKRSVTPNSELRMDVKYPAFSSPPRTPCTYRLLNHFVSFDPLGNAADTTYRNRLLPSPIAGGTRSFKDQS